MSRGPLTLFRGGTGERIFTGEASPAPDPGATSFEPVVLDFTYADLLAIVVGGFAYLPVATLADGDIVLVAGTEVTEVFDDTGAFVLQQLVQVFPAQNPLEHTVDSTSIVTPNAGILALGSQSGNGFDGNAHAQVSSAVVQKGAGPVAVVLSAATINGDGATGKGIARCLIVRAP